MFLAQGSIDPYVPGLHQILIEQGFDCGPDPDHVPPVFGKSTAEAVRLFQSSHVGSDGHCLVVDGIVGPGTWWALRHPSGASQVPTVLSLSGMPHQSPSNPVAAAALASAYGEANHGVFEIPDGSNRGPRIDLYTGLEGAPPSRKGPPWCAFFVSWNFSQSPHGSPFGRIGSAQGIARSCAKKFPGSVLESPTANGREDRVRPGDIGIIADGEDHGHAFHIAAVQGSTIWTVEGNSGNAVRPRKRTISVCRYVVNFDAHAGTPG
jgi:hypothetical protein